METSVLLLKPRQFVGEWVDGFGLGSRRLWGQGGECATSALLAPFGDMRGVDAFTAELIPLEQWRRRGKEDTSSAVT